MRRYTYIYMLFLACGLFDTSNGASSTPTTAQASSEELVREAFAEFDRACEEYYATSPYAQESIYVDELLEIKENKHIEDDCSLKKKKLTREIKSLKAIQSYYSEEKNLNPAIKEKSSALYAKVTKAERELDRLRRDRGSVDAFYDVVKERYQDKKMPDLIGKVIPLLKRGIQMEYCSLVDSLIKNNLSFFKELHKNPLLKFKKLDFDDIEMESTDINREIIESGGFLSKKYQKLLKNEINRRIESQDFRDEQSFDKIKLILNTDERIDQLIESLKKQKQYMPVWNIRKLVYGFFGEKVKDMSLFDLIEENPFDMIIIYTNIDRNLSYSYRYNTPNRRNDFASLGYYAEKDDKIYPSNYEYPSPYFIINHHKIDSDLQLYRWFVEAEQHNTGDEDFNPTPRSDIPSTPTTPRSEAF